MSVDESGRKRVLPKRPRASVIYGTGKRKAVNDNLTVGLMKCHVRPDLVREEVKRNGNSNASI